MKARNQTGMAKTALKDQAKEISASRKAAFQILLAVERRQSHSDDLLRGRAVNALSAPDRNLATALVLGVLRWQILLDRQILRCSRAPTSSSTRRFGSRCAWAHSSCFIWIASRPAPQSTKVWNWPSRPASIRLRHGQRGAAQTGSDSRFGG